MQDSLIEHVTFVYVYININCNIISEVKELAKFTFEANKTREYACQFLPLFFVEITLNRVGTDVIE